MISKYGSDCPVSAETVMAEVRERGLYSRRCWEEEGNSELTWSTRFISRLLTMVREELSQTGDRDWLVDAEQGTSVKISEIEKMSRSVHSYWSSARL